MSQIYVVLWAEVSFFCRPHLPGMRHIFHNAIVHLYIYLAHEGDDQALDTQTSGNEQNVVQSEQTVSDNEQIYEQDNSEPTTVIVAHVEESSGNDPEENTIHVPLSESSMQEKPIQSSTEENVNLHTTTHLTMSPQRTSSRISSRVR